MSDLLKRINARNRQPLDRHWSELYPASCYVGGPKCVSLGTCKYATCVYELSKSCPAVMVLVLLSTLTLTLTFTFTFTLL